MNVYQFVCVSFHFSFEGGGVLLLYLFLNLPFFLLCLAIVYSLYNLTSGAGKKFRKLLFHFFLFQEYVKN